MESYSKVTRFCFICNYVSRIIEPLASRCAKFRFKPLHQEVMATRIEYIANEEGLTLQPGVIPKLSEVSGGDLRKAITTMQSAVRLRGPVVTPASVTDVAGVVSEDQMQGLWDGCKKGDFEEMRRQVMEVIHAGYPAQQVLSQLLEMTLKAPELRDLQRATVAKHIAKTDKMLVDGADETLELLATGSVLLRVLNNFTVEV